MKDLADKMDAKTAVFDKAGLVKLAILAVGGQGGGVLANWILDLAESNGFIAQTTSVPGVAQRTGATIYYIEMMPKVDGMPDPVLALMPSPGDVDIVIAAEAMEAGRAVTRGLVSPDRTTVIASTHRMFAVSEKIVPGDGIAMTEPVLKGVEKSARRLICHDLQAVASQHVSHISASLFGALAGSGTLPFDKAQFEQTISISGRGVGPSLKGFEAAYELTRGKAPLPPGVTPPPEQASRPTKPTRLLREWAELLDQCTLLPDPVKPMARAGLEKTVDYQDIAYGREYLERLSFAVQFDTKNEGNTRSYAYSKTLAKYLANAMCYDDVIRVADLKTRGSRMARVRAEVEAKPETIVHVTEYVRPRAEEIIGMLPARAGRFIAARRSLVALTARLFGKPRHLRTDRVGSFLLLHVLAGGRRRRRGTLRHLDETSHTAKWLELAAQTLPKNYDLAVEVLNTRRLIKGYSDTHTRGLSKYDRVLEGIALVADRDDAADWARRLTAAALSDVSQADLDGVLKTIRSFV